jgi:hypothetical protein
MAFHEGFGSLESFMIYLSMCVKRFICFVFFVTQEK